MAATPDCHPDRPYEARGMCKPCYMRWWRSENAEHVKEYKARYRAENAEHIRKRRARYRTEHADYIREYNAQWRKENAEHIEEYNARYNARPRTKAVKKKWAEENPEKIRAAVRKYQATARGRQASRRAQHRRRAAGDITDADIEWLYATFNSHCAYCLHPVDGGTIDHMTPVSRGGNNDRSNLALACVSCNASKNDRTLLEFVSQ